MEDTSRLEGLLSLRLTVLKNSMLKDGQMSCRSLKHCVNGVAFHSLMQVEQARATAVIDIYQTSLTQQLDNYKTYLDVSVFHLYGYEDEEWLSTFDKKLRVNNRHKRDYMTEISSKYLCVVLLHTERKTICGELK